LPLGTSVKMWNHGSLKIYLGMRSPNPLGSRTFLSSSLLRGIDDFKALLNWGNPFYKTQNPQNTIYLFLIKKFKLTLFILVVSLRK
jgi:hypothetical protein